MPRRMTFAGVVLSAIVLAAPIALAQGVVVRVPRGPGQVYVPLDPLGRPIVPAAPAEPAAPAGPVSPLAPPAPASSMLPLPPGWGLLTIEVEPVTANVFLDGEPLGAIAAGIGAGRTIAIAPGFHRLETVAPGFRPASTSIALVSGQSLAVRLSLDAEAPSARLDTGYYVLPRGVPAPVPPRSGGGYFIVPVP